MHVRVSVAELPGTTWNAAAGFNRLFGLGRFSSPGTHTFKSAQKLAGRQGSPISMVKWHLSTCLLTGWLRGEAQGPGERAGSISTAIFYGGKPNCTRHLQTLRSRQLSTPSPWAGLEECITCMKIRPEAQTKGFQKLPLKFDFVNCVFFSIPTSFSFCKQPLENIQLIYFKSHLKDAK